METLAMEREEPDDKSFEGGFDDADPGTGASDFERWLGRSTPAGVRPAPVPVHL